MGNCTVTVLSANFHHEGGKAKRGDKLTMSRELAESIAAEDEAAGRSPRIEIAKRGRKSEAK